MRVKFQFKGVSDLQPRKHDLEIVDRQVHDEIVSCLLVSLEEIISYTGGADSALHDEYVVQRALNAIARAKGVV